MATDVITRMTAKAGGVLDEGEVYLGAQSLTVKGPNALAAVVAERDLATLLVNHAEREGGVSELRVQDDEIPNAFLVAVTGARLLVFGRSMSGKPKDLIAEYPVAETELDTIDYGDKVKARVFVFTVPSGEVFAGEAGINGKAQESSDRFVAAFSQARQG